MIRPSAWYVVRNSPLTSTSMLIIEDISCFSTATSFRAYGYPCMACLSSVTCRTDRSSTLYSL